MDTSLEVWIWAIRTKKADETTPLKGFHFVGLLDNWFLGVTPLNLSLSLPDIHYFDGSSIDDLCRVLSYGLTIPSNVQKPAEL